MPRIVFAVALLLAVQGTFDSWASLPPTTKNACLLYGDSCPRGGYSLPERIDKLKVELEQSAIYTPEERKILQKKLKEDQETLKNLKRPGKR